MMKINSPTKLRNKCRKPQKSPNKEWTEEDCDKVYICEGGPGKSVCGLELADNEESISCDLCEKWFHPKCQKLKEEEFLYLAKSRSHWFCHRCSEKDLPLLLQGRGFFRALEEKVNSRETSSILMQEPQSAIQNASSNKIGSMSYAICMSSNMQDSLKVATISPGFHKSPIKQKPGPKSRSRDIHITKSGQGIIDETCTPKERLPYEGNRILDVKLLVDFISKFPCSKCLVKGSLRLHSETIESTFVTHMNFTCIVCDLALVLKDTDTIEAPSRNCKISENKYMLIGSAVAAGFTFEHTNTMLNCMDLPGIGHSLWEKCAAMWETSLPMGSERSQNNINQNRNEMSPNDTSDNLDLDIPIQVKQEEPDDYTAGSSTYVGKDIGNQTIGHRHFSIVNGESIFREDKSLEMSSSDINDNTQGFHVTHSWDSSSMNTVLPDMSQLSSIRSSITVPITVGIMDGRQTYGCTKCDFYTTVLEDIVMHTRSHTQTEVSDEKNNVVNFVTQSSIENSSVSEPDFGDKTFHDGSKSNIRNSELSVNEVEYSKSIEQNRDDNYVGESESVGDQSNENFHGISDYDISDSENLEHDHINENSYSLEDISNNLTNEKKYSTGEELDINREIEKEEVMQKDEIIQKTSTSFHSHIKIPGKSSENTRMFTQNVIENIPDIDIFKCSFCVKEFNNELKLRAHMEFHSRVKKKSPFSCTKCDAGFLSLSGLKKHDKKHTQGREFPCTKCHFRFYNEQNLLFHMQIHDSEKPYSCNKCEYKSYYLSSLRRHIKIHTSEKSFACTICDYKAANRLDLKRHAKKHRSKKHFACSDCHFKCTTGIELRKHLISKEHTWKKEKVMAIKNGKKSKLLETPTKEHYASSTASTNLFFTQDKRVIENIQEKQLVKKKKNLSNTNGRKIPIFSAHTMGKPKRIVFSRPRSLKPDPSLLKQVEISLPILPIRLSKVNLSVSPLVWFK